jgi:hypothetical protein
MLVVSYDSGNELRQLFFQGFLLRDNGLVLRTIKPPTKYLNYDIISAWKKEMQEH